MVGQARIPAKRRRVDTSPYVSMSTTWDPKEPSLCGFGWVLFGQVRIAQNQAVGKRKCEIWASRRTSTARRSRARCRPTAVAASGMPRLPIGHDRLAVRSPSPADRPAAPAAIHSRSTPYSLGEQPVGRACAVRHRAMGAGQVVGLARIGLQIEELRPVADRIVDELEAAVVDHADGSRIFAHLAVERSRLASPTMEMPSTDVRNEAVRPSPAASASHPASRPAELSICPAARSIIPCAHQNHGHVVGPFVHGPFGP